MPGRVMLCGSWCSLPEAEAWAAEAAKLVLSRTYKRDRDGRFGSGGGVEELPRMAKPPTVQQAAQGANPEYGTTGEYGKNPVYREAGRAGERWTPEMGPLPSGAFEENCTNAVMAFEMRMRGYDVQAAPLDVLTKQGYAAGRTFREMEDQLASQWQMPDGSPHGRSFSSQPWRTFKEIDSEVAAWPEGGRGFMTTGKHVFSVVKKNGKAQYVEAQFEASPSRVVTTDYKRKYRGSTAFSGPVEEAKVVRLDDLVPTDGVLESVVAAR
jgi:hypothetical protein